MAGKSVIGIDLGPNVVKMVEYSPQKKEVLTIAKLFIKPSEWESADALYHKVLQWVEEKKQSAHAVLAVGLPGEKGVIRSFEMPEGKAEFPEHIAWELEQYLAEPVSEFVFDTHWQTEFQVLATAFRKELVQSYQMGLQSKSLPLAVLDVDAFAVVNAFEINYPEETRGPVLLLKADAHGLSCLNLSASLWKHMECIPLSQDYVELEEAEEKKEMLKGALDRLTAVFAGKSDRPEKGFYCGDLAADPVFVESLREALVIHWEPLNAFRKVTFPHDPEHQQKVQETAPQCAAALGLALRTPEDRP